MSHLGFKLTLQSLLGKVATLCGDLLDDPLGDLLIACAGALRTIALTILKTANYLIQLIIIYFTGSWYAETTM